MQFSLKEARRVERRIENAINGPLELNSEINIYEDENVGIEVSKARETTLKAVIDTTELIGVRASIRRAIQEANEHSGINAHIADRERLLRENTIWTMVINTGSYRQSVFALRKMVTDMQTNRTQTSMSSHYGRNDTVPFNAVSEDLVEEASRAKYSNQISVDGIDDKLASLNAKTTIEISNNDITFLKEQNII